ncbi:hypothetical protein QBC38DRAFT_447553 [Podospora fimiseda]|uniref:Uncharacterized protein n=1 Tax=Podospora fimiseda TaxID=252190 RepID=A0AAN7BH67_9PEZI|nr:hypothetical protein QBC38DRAFT_447553 [Podospora fimiseda]
MDHAGSMAMQKNEKLLLPPGCKKEGKKCCVLCVCLQVPISSRFPFNQSSNYPPSFVTILETGESYTPLTDQAARADYRSQPGKLEKRRGQREQTGALGGIMTEMVGVQPRRGPFFSVSSPFRHPFPPPIRSWVFKERRMDRRGKMCLNKPCRSQGNGRQCKFDDPTNIFDASSLFPSVAFDKAFFCFAEKKKKKKKPDKICQDHPFRMPPYTEKEEFLFLFCRGVFAESKGRLKMQKKNCLVCVCETRRVFLAITQNDAFAGKRQKKKNGSHVFLSGKPQVREILDDIRLFAPFRRPKRLSKSNFKQT